MEWMEKNAAGSPECGMKNKRKKHCRLRVEKQEQGDGNQEAGLSSGNEKTSPNIIG